MLVRLLAASLLLIVPPAQGADRRWGIASFDRLRVEAPVEVRVATGAAPRATASAGDPRLLERLSIEASGGTLVVRLASEDMRGPFRRDGAPLMVTLATPRLSGVALTAPGRVTVAGLAGERVTVAVTGTGTVAATAVDAQTLTATLVGSGSVTLAGRAATARLSTNGPGLIDAAALTTGSLSVLLDGAGETRGAARYDAQVNTTGLGRVTVTGNPKCSVRAPAGGPVRCGIAADAP